MRTYTVNNDNEKVMGVSNEHHDLKDSSHDDDDDDDDDDRRMQLLVTLMEGSVSRSRQATKEHTLSTSSLSSSSSSSPSRPSGTATPPVVDSDLQQDSSPSHRHSETNLSKKTTERTLVTPPPPLGSSKGLHSRLSNGNSLVMQMMPFAPLACPPRLPTGPAFFPQALHKIQQQCSLTKPRLLEGPTSSFHHHHSPRTPTIQLGRSINITASADGNGPPISFGSQHNHQPAGAATCQKEEGLSSVRRLLDEAAHASDESPSMLHSVCCWNDHGDLATIVTNVLGRDCKAIRRRFHLVAMKKMTSPTPALGTMNVLFPRPRQRYEPYTLPLNLALYHQPKNHPNMKVLQVLAQSGPDVLCMQDGGSCGSNGSTGGSLIIALRHHPKNLAIVRLLLETNPECIRVSDKRGNTPLHVACFHHCTGSSAESSSSLSLEIVQELYRHDPSAIDQENMNGETPWTLVQRNSRLSSSPVAEFLFACAARRHKHKRETKPAATC